MFSTDGILKDYLYEKPMIRYDLFIIYMHVEWCMTIENTVVMHGTQADDNFNKKT